MQPMRPTSPALAGPPGPPAPAAPTPSGEIREPTESASEPGFEPRGRLHVAALPAATAQWEVTEVEPAMRIGAASRRRGHWLLQARAACPTIELATPRSLPQSALSGGGRSRLQKHDA